MMWLDILRTPMAAPETPALKAMRLAILWSAIGLAIAICALQPLRAVLGAGAGGALAGLVLALVVLVPVYVIAKNRADNAFLDASLAAQPDGEGRA
ncbi:MULTISPECIES: hypothetical protein [Sphingomonadaceae]|jgi:hypothetical protein|uniref:Uncharacterized protein n=7 Tax=Sphingomonadaceae TaxID=41297 RepID=A0A7Y2KM78_SPHPI|nr:MULTISPECIES: hypothetical protein [Sphingomonadaceae]MBM3928719.1 hypothetical protein [Sphingomonadales bacterium]MBQ8102437.1 hypothetical protein [Afipia sp.]MDE0877245.1 hypothetical protein [Sphingomonas bacterium]AOW24713.1 hypothetical protein BJP26_14995 [Sphingomonas melonis TY]EGI53976.1 hypothetical protein SUS17_3176 [Sphingomonas sp. S17]